MPPLLLLLTDERLDCLELWERASSPLSEMRFIFTFFFVNVCILFGVRTLLYVGMAWFLALTAWRGVVNVYYLAEFA